MVRGVPLRSLVALLVASQLATSAIGGSLLVNCRGADGHQAVEIAHAGSCEATENVTDDGQRVIDALASERERCADKPLGVPDLLREQERPAPSLSPAVAVLWILEFPLPFRTVFNSRSHFRLSDSAHSLARSVILLI